MARTKGSNGARIDKNAKDIFDLKQKADKAQDQWEKHVKMHIEQDLNTKKFPGSEKPLYTYEEIADKHGVSKSKVQKVAEEVGHVRKPGLRVV